ncbi:glycerol-3-phosphate 1-O-acyltransferase PlsY [Pullulanibacillus sp. KACC 23026]|uniref:glycerol-3-phosphate 1-O-acyltransferase PlsY n=1 Tax=Pullulanibacillus sp. KACC 23026 TaxID=3028315 RepID=UPI0023B07B94|nr:glycerol-3-phosphate 1-O-acyltransferase PlsY [Pullulanibacillus sp. KACC 23026]WEG11385.1 glycerol-3-phosphate 1-O-acyltransferase PlsY [Pullulanibacillus sp. KACC 23026]
MTTFIAFLVAYLIGSISFSIIFTKAIKKVDIRNYGSGNAGATNTMRVLGKGPAILVLLLDAIKGIVAILIAKLLHLPEWAVDVTGLLAMVGHVWPVYHGFKGGKGVATTIGIFLVLAPIPTVITGIITIIIIAVTRYVSLGSLFLILVTPLLSYFFGASVSFVIVGLILFLLSAYKHRENIVRLIHGNENKLGAKKA